MKRKMYPVDVTTDENGDVAVTQEWNDMNEPDPVVTISPEQAGLVAAWIVQAATEAGSGNEEEFESVPVKFFNRGPEPELQDMKVYNNNSGMIILGVDKDTFIEVSPIMAKRLRDQLTKAISVAYTDMMRSDDEV